MNSENVLKSRRTSFKDNKGVDLFAAILTGLGLFFYDLLIVPTPSFGAPPTYGEILQKVTIRVGAFVVSALIFFVWRHPIRAKWGWIPIAIIGLIIMAQINEMIWRAGMPEHIKKMPIFQAFGPSLIVYLYFVPTLVLMGAAHYSGMLLLAKGRKKFA